MPDIIVDTYKLTQYSQRLSAINDRINQLDCRLDALYQRVGLLGLCTLKQADAMTCYSWRLVQCQSYLQQTALDYEWTEQVLLSEDSTNFNGVSVEGIIKAYEITAPGAINGSGTTERLKEDISTKKPCATVGVLSLISPVAGLLYITSGIAYGEIPSVIDPSREPSTNTETDWWRMELEEDGLGFTAWGGKASKEFENKWLRASGNAYLGKIEAKADADFELMSIEKEELIEKSDGKPDVDMEIFRTSASAVASASLLASDGAVEIGTDMIALDYDAEVSVGTIKAEGKGVFSVSEDGVDAYIGGEAMAAIVEGYLTRTVNFLGIEITGEIGGYAGAVGATGKIGIEDNKFVMKAGLADGLGLSGKVAIGFNEEGWDNCVDFAKHWKGKGMFES